MNLKIYAIACLCMGVAGCASTQPVVIEATQRALPVNSMRADAKVVAPSDESPQQLKLTLADAIDKYEMCSVDKYELIKWIVQSRADNAKK